MFCIDPAPEFAFEATIPASGDQPAQKLKLRGRHKDREQLKAWIESARATQDDAAWLGDVLCGWEGVQTQQGDPVPFGLDPLRQVLSRFGAASDAIVDAYCRALRGERQKN